MKKTMLEFLAKLLNSSVEQFVVASLYDKSEEIANEVLQNNPLIHESDDTPCADDKQQLSPNFKP